MYTSLVSVRVKFSHKVKWTGAKRACSQDPTDFFHTGWHIDHACQRKHRINAYKNVCTIHKRSSHQNRNLTVWKKNKINQINESTEEEKALQCCLTQDHAVFSHFSFPRYLPAWLLSSLISYKDDSNLKLPPLWFSKLNVEKTSNITTFTLVLYTVSSLPLSVPHPH